MKAESRREVFVAEGEGLARLKSQGVSLFASGLSLFLMVLIGVPVVMVILMSLRTGFPGETVPLTLANYLDVYANPRTYQVLLNTLFFAVTSVSVALLITVPLVWILMRTDIPLKKTIYVLLTIGILIPVFLRTIAWIILLSPRIGLLNKWLQQIFDLAAPPFNLYSLPGMAFVQGISFVPGAFFMLAAAYRSMDPSLEEAAYTSGVSKLRTFLKINIPITWPAIAAVMVYLFMTALAVFEVPAIIGLPARIIVLSSLIFQSTSPNTGLPDYGMAGADGAIMLLFGLLDTLAFVPHAVPGILMAVGLAYLGLSYRDVFPLYGTVFIIVIAHTINWIAYGTRTTNSVMIQVHRELEEAGRVAGASVPRVLWKIVLPLIAAGVLNSWVWIGMLSYREVTMALTLYTRNNVVISTVVWQFWGSGWVPQVAALGVILILFATIVVGTVRVVLSRIGEIGEAS